MSSQNPDKSGSPGPGAGHGSGTAGPEIPAAGPEQELELARKKLQVVGSITRHDVLNQMTAIMGYNELLLTMVQDEKLRHFLEIERRSSEKLRRIFAFSKVFQLIRTEPPRWQKLDAIVHLACDEADLKSVPVIQETGEVSLFADPEIVKVFAYLFDNAVRHGNRTTAIRLKIVPAGSAATLVVEDDGTGIPAEYKERIFEHGFGKYTGWGLFVAREILLSSGMTIRETGTEGKGARFEITIPAGRIRIGKTPPAP